MKFSLVPLLPLLLAACVSNDPASTSQPAAAGPAVASTKAKVEPAAPSVTSMPEPAAMASKPAPTTKDAMTNYELDPALAPEAPAAAPVQAAPELRQEGAQPTTAPVAPAAPASVPAPAQAAPTPAQAPEKTAPPKKPQLHTVQMPTTPPLPLPVVLAPEATVDERSLSGRNLGGPIRVFDKTITENDLRRHLCYAIGSKQLESLKYGVICDQEIEKRRAAGEDISQLAVTDAEFEKALEKTRKDFLLKYPTLDFPVEVGRAFLSLDVYKLELRRTMVFDKAFFPQDPALWPAVTTEAVILAAGGRSFVDDAFESYAGRKQLMIDQHMEDLPPEDPILVDTLRSWLLDSLNQFSSVESDQAKLPADTLLIVDGVPIKVEALWNLIEPHVTWENVADARRFLTQLAVVERDLKQKDVLISQAEFEQTFMPNVPFKDAMTNYEMVAIVIYGFPSMPAYIPFERMLRSYRKLIADDIATNEKLQPFMQRANMIAGASRIDAEVILASAFDFKNARWAADGWIRAERKALDLKQKLDAGGDWGEILELHSEYWDPPMPEIGQKPQFGFNFKGRFGQQTRNQFQGDLHESDFTMFLRGKSIADQVYFEQPGGMISDVMKGSRGYYIARVNSRSPGTSGLNLQVPLNREYAVNFVATNRFGVYARQLLTEAIAKGDVTGF